VAEERAKRSKVLETGTAGGRALLLVPLLVATVMGALVMPRSGVPDGVPLPLIDGRALAGVVAHDAELAARARRETLPSEVRALGSAIREFNLREARGAEEAALSDARHGLDEATALALTKGVDALVELRALQLDEFLAEVSRFEDTGKESDELQALGGSFVRRMRSAGWCDEHNQLALDPSQRRAAFKATWAALINQDARPELHLTLDEMRALYTLYIQHPHAPEALRAQLEASRKETKDPHVCAELALRESNAVEEWRIEKLRKLGQLDPSYPTAYALGIAQFRRAQYPAAAEAFRTWLQQHPSGPYALRARNYLKTSIEAAAF
jgi:hypothetical protein